MTQKIKWKQLLPSLALPLGLGALSAWLNRGAMASYAVWNTLKCTKESLLTPINEHWTTAETNRGQMEWIKAHLLK